MEILLRQLRVGADGTREFQDTDAVADLISIGSAPDCLIQLLGEGVEAHHGAIARTADAFELRCGAGRTIMVNGAPRSAGPLQIGDRLELEGHRLTLAVPPTGFDLAIEIEPNGNVASSSFEKAFSADLSRTWLSKRSGSWTLAIAVLLVGLVIPLLTIALHHAGIKTPGGVVDDTFWTPGPLLAAHQLATENRCELNTEGRCEVKAGSCEFCHQSLFIHVQDKACTQCHQGTADHVAADRLAHSTLGPKLRCATCHRDHSESGRGLIVRDNRLCTDCHADSAKRFGALKVESVTGFGLRMHPAYNATVFNPKTTADGIGLLGWEPRRVPVATATEQSNLKFSHAQHLDRSRVRRNSDNAALGCGDCHVLAADGEHFIPITMQSNCSGCHELAFDPGAPTPRKLPHGGKPSDTMLLIRDYFTRKFVQPDPEPVRTVERRRLPDRPADEEPTARCTGPALVCARQSTDAEIRNQFAPNGRGCIGCHVVTDTGAAEVLDRYQVTTIRLARDYFPDVHFSHRSHAVQKEKSGDDACVSCHAVRQSKFSTDLVLPDLPKCLECHSQSPTRDRVTLQCMSCHSYHPAVIMAEATQKVEIR